jgi:hypothetical protein
MQKRTDPSWTEAITTRIRPDAVPQLDALAALAGVTRSKYIAELVYRDITAHKTIDADAA